jgi:hypothetical protein
MERRRRKRKKRKRQRQIDHCKANHTADIELNRNKLFLLVFH